MSTRPIAGVRCSLGHDYDSTQRFPYFLRDISFLGVISMTVSNMGGAYYVYFFFSILFPGSESTTGYLFCGERLV